MPNSSPAHTVKEFIDYVKAKPGKITMASPGTGSSPHLAIELFKKMAGLDMSLQIDGNRGALSTSVRLCSSSENVWRMSNGCSNQDQPT